MRTSFSQRMLSCLMAAMLVFNPLILSVRADEKLTITNTDAADSYMYQATPTTNNGAATEIRVRSSAAANRRSILQFNYSTIPNTAAVKAATVGVTLTQAPAATRTDELHRVTGAAAWTEAGVTWNCRSGNATCVGGTAWTTAGGDFDATVASSLATGTTVGAALTFPSGANMISAVQTILQGTNLGWLIKDSVENSATTRFYRFGSKENATAANRPSASVDYMRPVSAAAGSTTVPSQVALTWTQPGAAANYDHVLVTRLAGATAPCNQPADATTYTVGNTITASSGGVTCAAETDNIVALTTAFGANGVTDENGDRSMVAPSTQYSYTIFNADTGHGNIAGALAVAPYYAFGSKNNAGTAIAGTTVTVTTAALGTGAARNWSYVTDTTGTAQASLAPPAPTGFGSVAAGAPDGYVRTMSDANGAQRYKPASGGAGFTNASAAISSRPTLIDKAETGEPTCTAGVCDVAYVTSSGTDHAIYSFRMDTGALLWSLAPAPGLPLLSSPSVVLRSISGLPYDLVIFGTHNTASKTANNLYAIRTDTHAVLWTFGANGAGATLSNLDLINSEPWVDYNTGSIWFTSGSNSGTQPSIWQIDYATGGTTRKHSISVDNTAVAIGDVLAAPSVNFAGTYLFAVNTAGKLLVVNTGGTPAVVASATGGGSVPAGYPVIFDRGTAVDVYWTSTTNNQAHFRTFTLSGQTLNTGWDVTLAGSAVPTSPVINYKAVPPTALYVGGSDGNIHRLDLTAAGADSTQRLVSAGKQIGDLAIDFQTTKFILGDTSGHIYSFDLF